MAQFLDKSKAVSELTDIIKAADTKLTLISAYVELTPDLKTLLAWRAKHEKKTELIFRKGQVKQEVINFLLSLNSVTLFECENLHTKCFFNEKKMIIGSLNLLQSSIVNNHEMGVLIDKDAPEDLPVYLKAIWEAGFIKENSQPLGLKASSQKAASHNKFGNHAEKHYGYCIRTGARIPFNFDRPFSHEGFRLWNEYGNPFYPEKFCHFSGEPSNGETTYQYPVMRKNYQQALTLFGHYTM